MHVTINVKSPNNISEWQMGFNSAFKGLNFVEALCFLFSLYHLNDCFTEELKHDIRGMAVIPTSDPCDIF